MAKEEVLCCCVPVATVELGTVVACHSGTRRRRDKRASKPDASAHLPAWLGWRVDVARAGQTGVQGVTKPASMREHVTACTTLSRHCPGSTAIEDQARIKSLVYGLLQRWKIGWLKQDFAAQGSFTGLRLSASRVPRARASSVGGVARDRRERARQHRVQAEAVQRRQSEQQLWRRMAA